jgi:hypothetical protein
LGLLRNHRAVCDDQTHQRVCCTGQKLDARGLDTRIWWRLGRRIGVGGLTGEGEAMAALLDELSRGANSES